MNPAARTACRPMSPTSAFAPGPDASPRRTGTRGEESRAGLADSRAQSPAAWPGRPPEAASPPSAGCAARSRAARVRRASVATGVRPPASRRSSGLSRSSAVRATRACAHAASAQRARRIATTSSRSPAPKSSATVWSATKRGHASGQSQHGRPERGRLGPQHEGQRARRALRIGERRDGLGNLGRGAVLRAVLVEALGGGALCPSRFGGASRPLSRQVVVVHPDRGGRASPNAPCRDSVSSMRRKSPAAGS